MHEHPKIYTILSRMSPSYTTQDFLAMSYKIRDRFSFAEQLPLVVLQGGYNLWEDGRVALAEFYEYGTIVYGHLRRRGELQEVTK